MSTALSLPSHSSLPARTPELFSNLLESYFQTTLYSCGQLAQLSGVPKRTIVNWLDGTTERPRNWQSILRVAGALRLDVDQANRLLEAAGYDSLARLAERVAAAEDRKLLAPWIGAPDRAEANLLLRQYLAQLAQALNVLPAYFPRHATACFQEFYVDPRLRPLATGPHELSSPPLPNPEGELWSILRAHTRRAVILGQPGMGKSWMLKGEANRIATEALTAPEGEMVQKLPLFVRVGDLAPMLTSQSTLEEILGAAVRLAVQMTPTLAPDKLTMVLIDFVKQHPEQVTLLLDALDEVPDRNQYRAIARRAVVLLGATRLRLFLASRTLGYAGAPLARYLGPDTAELELVPADSGRIAHTIRIWFAHQPELGRRLQVALRRAPALIRQAVNPLLLSLICMLTEVRQGVFSGSRAELYDPVLRLLLEGRWRSFDLQLPESRIRLKLRLLELAAWTFATYQGGWHTQLVGEKFEPALEATAEAERLWRTWRPEWGTNYEGVLYELSEWDGILVKSYTPADGAESAAPYAFLHRTLQEYLVSRYLLRCYEEEGIESPDLQRFLTELIVNQDWYVVVLLVVEQLTTLPLGAAKSLLDPLAIHLIAQMRPGAVHLDLAMTELLLGIQATRENDPVMQPLLARLRALMADVSETCVSIRVHAARLVARVGDPRPEVTDVDAIEFVEVPAGEFRMGSDPAQDPESFGDEFPQFRYTLPAFAVARLPITYAQFQYFLEERDTVYLDQELWPEAIALGHWREGMIWRTGLTEVRDGKFGAYPRWSTHLNPIGWPAELPNSPAAGMNWYEAMAFVRWLDRRWHRLGKLADDEFLDLPSEAEWEKAARGVDGRIYPWGNVFDSNRLNWYGHMLMSMTPIGCFPNSASPYGVEEMVGNLAEFTRSVYLPYAAEGWVEQDFYDNPRPDVKLVARGGAHFHVRTRCRAASRIAIVPFGNASTSFRLVKRTRMIAMP